MKSLRTKMTILIVLVVFGSMMLLSFTSYQRAKKSLISQIEDNYTGAAQKFALELSSWVSTNATIIDTMAAEIAVNDISEKDYDTFHRYLQHSNELLNKNGYVYDVYFTYPDNYMVCASDFVSDGTVDFVHEREWYTTSALTGELFYSSPYLDSDSKRSIITISKAVYKDDELLGVLAADIFVDVLVDMVRNAQVDENSYACLMDQNMKMIVHPDSRYDYDDSPKGVTEVSPAYRPVVDAIAAANHDMVFVKDYDGIKRGITFSPMINTGWYVCIATSTDVLDESVSSMMRGFIIATVLSICISAVIAVFLARVLDKLSTQEQEYKERVLVLEKQAADESNKAKSRFLADMSHEIRTPINAIIGMNEMIMRETDDRNIRVYAKNIRQSGHSLLHLINGILDFSKIEDGKMDIVPVKYVTAEQISYLINSVSERAAANGLEFKLDIDKNLPSELCGDNSRINQVVMNLLTNAVKYTEKGSVTLCVRKKEQKDNRVLIYYEVSDTGIGIKEEEMPKLFESFERLDVVRNRNIEGTGLGMAISLKLLHLMGSELEVKSRYGEGSVFSFSLWQDIVNAEPLGDYMNSVSKYEPDDSYEESFHAKDAKILVVDDTFLNIFVVSNLLKRTGVAIDTAQSGPESVELAKNNLYDVILMDQRMPGMSGTEAMKIIRSLDAYKDKGIPIICLTADVIRGAKDRYLLNGFDDYLTKPVDGAELEKLLMKYIPEEKIERCIVSKKDNTEDDGEYEKIVSAFSNTGIDAKAGIRLCGNDEDAYRLILLTYAGEEKKKSDLMAEKFGEKNWKDYGIYVHALKSSSKTIGASQLSALAESLESAAKNGDIAAIEQSHERLLMMYEETARAIKDRLGYEEALEKEEDILEFLPDSDI